MFAILLFSLLHSEPIWANKNCFQENNMYFFVGHAIGHKGATQWDAVLLDAKRQAATCLFLTRVQVASQDIVQETNGKIYQQTSHEIQIQGNFSLLSWAGLQLVPEFVYIAHDGETWAQYQWKTDDVEKAKQNQIKQAAQQAELKALKESLQAKELMIRELQQTQQLIKQAELNLEKLIVETQQRAKQSVREEFNVYRYLRSVGCNEDLSLVLENVKNIGGKKRLDLRYLEHLHKFQWGPYVIHTRNDVVTDIEFNRMYTPDGKVMYRSHDYELTQNVSCDH